MRVRTTLDDLVNILLWWISINS